MSNRNRVTFELNLTPGTVIQGRYELEALIGEGGFAAVFEAFDRNIERNVAVKVLDVGLLPSNEKLRQKLLDRFRREASFAGRIKHPGVVGIYDYGFIGEQTEHPFIVMERLEGWDLEEQIFERGPLAAERALPLFIGGLEALGEAHEKGIVHKDLKPSNLFLADPGEAYESLRVVDFGVAFMENAAEGRLTQTGEILGTPNYLPPEYINEQIATPALDVYQMALILLELLSGRRVVTGATAMRCIYTHIAGELEIPKMLAESELGPILVAALAMDHERRFAHGKAFANALRTVDPSSIPRIPDGEIAHVQPLLSEPDDARVQTEDFGEREREDSGQTLPGLGQVEEFDTQRFIEQARSTGALSARQTSRLIDLGSAFEDERPESEATNTPSKANNQQPRTRPEPTTERGVSEPAVGDETRGPQAGLEGRAPSMWEFSGDAYKDEESNALSQPAIQTRSRRSSGVPMALGLVALVLVVGLGGAFAYVYYGSEADDGHPEQQAAGESAPADTPHEPEPAADADNTARDRAAGLAKTIGGRATDIAGGGTPNRPDELDAGQGSDRPRVAPERAAKPAPHAPGKSAIKRREPATRRGESLWVGVNSEPSGAIVTTEGKLVGRTPCKVKFEPDEKTQTIRFEKDGYELLEIDLARGDHPSRSVRLSASGGSAPSNGPSATEEAATEEATEEASDTDEEEKVPEFRVAP
jgi:serine/threonine protein kinase